LKICYEQTFRYMLFVILHQTS